jgi:hypothetical protein
MLIFLLETANMLLLITSFNSLTNAGSRGFFSGSATAASTLGSVVPVDEPGSDVPGKSWASKKGDRHGKNEAKNMGRKVFALNVILVKSFNLKIFQF